jgi:crossover junction endodeoxyribonuclease RuvC
MSRSAGRSWRSFDPAQARPRAAVTGSPLPCRILGLDPGSLRTGWGVIDLTEQGERHVANGCIRTGGGALPSRLRAIHDGVADLVQQYRPQEVAIERVFVHRNPDSALKLGQARGAALTAVALPGVEIHEYSPRAVKLAVVGTGAADKAQVAHMIRALLRIASPLGADAADALAIGVCHGQARRLQRVGASVVVLRRRAV